MSRSFFILLLFILGIFLSCQSAEEKPVSENSDPYATIQDEKVRSLLKKAITKAGGLENWNKLERMQFQKYFALYREDGSTENEVLQQHNYLLQPKEQINITWRKDNLNHKILFEDGAVKKMINRQADTLANLQSLKNSVLSATFVISIPYKLLDEGVELSYAGLDTLEDNQVVEVLKASYAPEKHNNHSTSDIWWHYFDAKDYKQLGYMVQHVDHYSYVKNLSFHENDGFVFPKSRESYRVDSLRNILYLRAKYLYEDYTLH